MSNGEASLDYRVRVSQNRGKLSWLPDDEPGVQRPNFQPTYAVRRAWSTCPEPIGLTSDASTVISATV